MTQTSVEVDAAVLDAQAGRFGEVAEQGADLNSCASRAGDRLGGGSKREWSTHPRAVAVRDYSVSQIRAMQERLTQIGAEAKAILENIEVTRIDLLGLDEAHAAQVDGVLREFGQE